MNLIVALITSFLITFILLPIIIKVSRSIDLLDAPDRRKIHSISTPSLGGIAIYIGFILATLIAIPFAQLVAMKFVLAGTMVIFFLGIRDDISSLQAQHKLFTQLFAAFLVVVLADIRLTGFYGLMGIHELPIWLNVTFTVFVVVILTNSFNLIDGIDGLAGSVGVFILSFLAWFFLKADMLTYALLSLSLIGSLIAFLYFNWNPSKVFMGDTGSLLVGFSITTLIIQFINNAQSVTLFSELQINAPVALAVALLIIPIYDTLRVFVIRFLRGKNPLDPDRNHLHHGLLRLGMSHSQATITLVLFNAYTVVLALFLNQFLLNGELLLILLLSTVSLCSIVDIKLYQKRYSHKVVKVKSDKDVYLSKSA